MQIQDRFLCGHWEKFWVIGFLINWHISTGILTRIAQAILVKIPVEMRQFTRIPMSNDCLQRVVYIAKLSYTPQYRIEGFKGEPLGPWRRTIIFRGLRGALNCTSIMPRGASGCKIFHSNCWSNKRMHAKKSIYESCSIKHCLDYNYSISIDLTSNGILFVAKSIRTHYSWLINYVFILSYVISLFRLVWPRTVFSLMLNQSENYIDNSNCDQFNQIQKYLYLCKRVQRAYVQQLKKNIYIYIRLYFTFLQHYTFSWSIKIN